MSRQRTMAPSRTPSPVMSIRRNCGELAQVDEQRRRSNAERHHRHQALAAREHLGVAVARGEQRDRLGERRRARIFESGQFHLALGRGAGTRKQKRRNGFPSTARNDRST